MSDSPADDVTLSQLVPLRLVVTEGDADQPWHDGLVPVAQSITGAAVQAQIDGVDAINHDIRTTVFAFSRT
ncbi:hypothetical protein GCM10009557_23040 [Virgisporangium ochraceum]|uniref:Uncharacterized protein n=1 Tax=Virgisporangium ochraceum TaxID=65505 RepID=A0A8J4A5X6_9ACTN|nr:hypothetical protein [Virgisporangium ochraceum]GIJ75127.1 hypothetical protein Voc01_100440 [Virgisporangium ochraceum]